MLRAGIRGSELLIVEEQDHGMAVVSPEEWLRRSRVLARGFTFRMKDTISTEVHFSRAAAVYQTRAELQRGIAGKLLQYLSQPAEVRRILELGCGTGFLTGRLVDSLATAEIDAIDLSAAMIEQARRAVGSHDRIRWHVCDVWNYESPQVFDLIASSSSLQWMQPLDELFRRLGTMLKPGGKLLCALMVEGTLGELHRLRREIAPHKPPRHRLRRSPARPRPWKTPGSG